MAEGCQDPGLKDGLVEGSGRVSINALEIWRIWSLGIKNAFLQGDGFGREVFLQAPAEWEPGSTHRIWQSHAPAYGLKGAPAASRRSRQRYLGKSANSSARAGLKFQVSSFGPGTYFISRKSGRA